MISALPSNRPSTAPAAAGQPPAPPPKPRRGPQHRRLPPALLLTDTYHAQGQTLLAAQRSPDALERLLAVLRLSLSMAADWMRPVSAPISGGAAAAPDPRTLPVSLVGRHVATLRLLGRRVDGGCEVDRVQEVCCFDAQEGPRHLPQPVSAAGEVSMLAQVHWQVDPTARAKAKRLGRDAYVKVNLHGRGHVILLALGQEHGEGEGHEEGYDVAMPELVLSGDLPHAAALAYKGDLVVQCSVTGLVATLTFTPGAGVQGHLEHVSIAAPERSASGRGGSSKAPPARQLGTFTGRLESSITAACADIGLEGVVWDASTLPSPPAATLNLSALPPMTHPLLWSALHGALMHTQPAGGGRAAAALAQTLSTRLGALSLARGAQGHSTSTSSSRAAAAAAGKAGAATAAAAAAAPGADADSEGDSDFEGAAEGEGGGIRRKGGKRGGSATAPAAAAAAVRMGEDLPPSCKAEYTAGRKLRWQLEHTIQCLPPGALQLPL